MAVFSGPTQILNRPVFRSCEVLPIKFLSIMNGGRTESVKEVVIACWASMIYKGFRANYLPFVAEQPTSYTGYTLWLESLEAM